MICVRNIKIAIDGPGGSGKSSVAKAIAKQLNIVHIDTGAMYRATALYAKLCGVPWHNQEGIVHILDDMEIEILHDESFGQKTILNGNDVTMAIRTAQIGAGASVVAAYLDVRKKLVDMQRQLAKNQSVVADGRDIGTVVLSDAQIKLYITASLEERTKRRCNELDKIGEKYDYNDIMTQIKKRDYNDSNREHDRLMVADDAIVINTDGMDFDEVVSKVIEIIRTCIQ